MNTNLPEWPEDLPTPLIGRSHTFDPRNIATTMDSQRIRIRRAINEPIEFIEARWNFTEDNFDQFKTFFEIDLENAESHFVMVTYDPNPAEAGTIREVHRELAFVEPKYSQAHSDNCVMVTATLEVVDTVIFIADDPNARIPALDFEYPPHLGPDMQMHVCYETFAFTFPVVEGLKYIVQIGPNSKRSGPWSDHVYFTCEETGVKRMEFNNDYNNDFYFRVVRAEVDRVIRSPAKPRKSELAAPVVLVESVINSPHVMWASNGQTLAYSKAENGLINNTEIYFVPRARYEWTTGPFTGSIHDFNSPNPVLIGVEPGCTAVYTRDGRDPKYDTLMPMLDGVENNVSCGRDDFGMMVKTRAFKDNCRGPMTVVLVDKKIWSTPYQVAVGVGQSASDACDIPREDHYRVDWSRDTNPFSPDFGKFLTGLEPFIVETGDTCGLGTTPTWVKMIGYTRLVAVPSTSNEFAFFRLVSFATLGGVAWYNEGQPENESSGDVKDGFLTDYGSCSFFGATSWEFNRQVGKWSNLPAVFSNAVVSLVDLGIPVEAYLTTISALQTIGGASGSSVGLENLIENFITARTLDRIAGNATGNTTFDIYTLLTTHDDFQPPASVAYVPPDPIVPDDNPPAPIIVYHDTFDEYADTDDAATANLNGGIGFTGTWTFSSFDQNDGFDTFETYPDGEVTETMGDGEAWGGDWTFSDGEFGTVHKEDFQSYANGYTGALNAGDGVDFDGLWSFSNGLGSVGQEDFESYPDGEVSATMEGGTRFIDLPWTFSDGQFANGVESFQSYPDGLVTGAENGGTGWSGVWSFN